MTAVYRQLRTRFGIATTLVLALACRQETPPSERTDSRLQPRAFELTDFLASQPADPESAPVRERLAALGAPWPGEAIAPQPVPAMPEGFRVAAASPRGERVALVRDLDPETTEVLLHDRGRGETRLLLPLDRDAGFVPLHFSADGTRLYYFSDEGDDLLQLEVLEIDSSRRERRAKAGCEATTLDFAPDDRTYALQWSCRGRAEAALFDAASGAELGPLPLPRETRLVRAFPMWPSGAALYAVAASRFPRDLLLAPSIDPDADARPLTFRLSPAIRADDLVDPEAIRLHPGSGGAVEAELWWPRRASGAPGALVWIEDDRVPPAWFEFHPFFQFLANRGIASVRLRPRGARGFGKSFRHAADGRLLESAFEDFEAARAELVRRGADSSRIVLVGDGPWAGASALAVREARTAGYAAVAAIAPDPDPLAIFDRWATIAEPARSWWQTRLGDPASDGARRTRARLLSPPNPGGVPYYLVPKEAGEPIGTAVDFAGLWSFFRPVFGAPP